MMTKNEFKMELWRYGQEQRAICGASSPERRARIGSQALVARKAILDAYDAMAARIAELEEQIAEHAVYSHEIATLAEARERITELEAERDAARAEAQARLESYNAEVDELNAGFDAYRAGLSLYDQPEVIYDVWRVGYAWAAYDAQTERIAELEAMLKRVLVEAVAEDGGRRVLHRDTIAEIAALLRSER